MCFPQATAELHLIECKEQPWWEESLPYSLSSTLHNVCLNMNTPSVAVDNTVWITLNLCLSVCYYSRVKPTSPCTLQRDEILCLEEHRVAYKSIKSSVHSVDAWGNTARLEQSNNRTRKINKWKNCAQAVELILAQTQILQKKIKGSLRLILTKVGKRVGSRVGYSAVIIPTPSYWLYSYWTYKGAVGLHHVP